MINKVVVNKHVKNNTSKKLKYDASLEVHSSNMTQMCFINK